MTDATTAFRFGPCELDERRRVLTAHGREVRLQPRVFDLLCYLVRHRDRVVPKEELLEAVWPGTVVVDNALQRAVRLARVALSEAGMVDVVRTYSRHGYRFCLDDCEPAPPALPVSSSRSLEEARAACDRHEWSMACERFAAADAQASLATVDIEEWGRAAICAGLGLTVTAALERAVGRCESANDALGAVRATLLLVQIRTDQCQMPLARGLLQRAARHLEGLAPTGERGHFAWMASRVALGSGDVESALAMGEEACAIGRALRDPDIECLGLVYRGHALMARGDVRKGIDQHDEAAAVVQLGGLSPWVGGWALCGLLYAARHRCDWLRAAQFAEAYAEWTRATRMPAFPGTCQLHSAAVLGMRGDIDRALTEAQAAVSLVARDAPYAEGDAYCVLGELQLGIGDFAAAEASFRQAHSLGWDPQPGLARLQLAAGRPDLAQRGLELALAGTDWTMLERRAQLLCLLVQAAVAAGDVERGREALATIAGNPQMLTNEALKGMHATAQAEIASADGDVALAIQRLRVAIRHWREVGSPACEGETRLRLAECLAKEGDVASAELELRAIESRFPAAAAIHRARMHALREAVQAA